MGFFDKMSGKKKKILLAVIGIIGILLVIIGTVGEKKKASTASENLSSKNPSTFTMLTRLCRSFTDGNVSIEFS